MQLPVFAVRNPRSSHFMFWPAIGVIHKYYSIIGQELFQFI
jgi:hypothetical protein